jgi:hypothetical protein
VRGNGGNGETITNFMSDLFSDDGNGILQFQDGSTASTSAQWAELDAALANAPQPAPSPASAPAPYSVPAKHASHRRAGLPCVRAGIPGA